MGVFLEAVQEYEASFIALEALNECADRYTVLQVMCHN
jgi:hypothetical protein